MNKSIIILFTLILLSSITFAVAPVLSDINISPISVTDHNYSNWKTPNAITLTTLVTGLDLNKDGCGYAINGTFTYPTAIDLNTDTNILTYSVIAVAINDVNWGLSCTNTSGQTGYKFRTIYLDANAPTSTSSFDESTTLTITATDTATNTGNGSGIEHLYYRINGGIWTDAGAITSKDLTLTPGDYTIDFYAIDSLDNNEWTIQGDYRSTTFYAGNFNRGTCGLTNSFILILVAGVLLALVFGGIVAAILPGDAITKITNTIGAIAATTAFMLIIYIIAVLLGVIC